MAILTWVLSPIGSFVSVLVVMFVAWQASGYMGEQRGAAKTAAKIEKANDNAAKLGARAADKSRAGGVQSQRDPFTRD
jgi:hypothetical protein